MNKILSIISIILSAAALVSCEHDGPDAEAGEGIKVTLRCVDDPNLKSGTRDGVGGENVIRTVDYFLFTGDGSSGVYRFKGRLNPEIEEYFTFYIQSSFVSNGDYTVYTIVNYPGNASDLGPDGGDSNESERKTLEELQSIVLSESEAPSFCDYSSGEYSAISTDDVSLVMTGQSTFTVSITDRPLVGTANIDLSRLASKLTVQFYISDKVEKVSGSVTEVWTPMVDGGVRLYLCRANETIIMNGENLNGDNTSRQFDYLPNTDVTPIAGKTGFQTGLLSPSFYSYPEKWRYGGPREPYIKIIIPWLLSRTVNGITTTSQKEFYYKVVLPYTHFDRNKWYNLILDITQLGSDSENDAVNLICSYKVADWGAEDIVVSSLVQGYYLDVMVNNRNITIYNDEVDIPYTSSGKTVMKNLSVSYVDFTTHEVVTLPNPEDYITLYDDHVHVEHFINTDYSGTSYDVSPYTFKFTLHLDAAGSDASYDKLVTVEQKPPLYIQQKHSDGKVWVRGSNSTSYIFDNSGVTTRSAANHYHYLGSVAEPSEVDNSGTNRSQYYYEIAATIIDMTVNIDGSDQTVVIGDPRGAAVDYSADLTGLSNYRPVAENTKNVIAPRIIFASSYGKTYSLSYESAQRRCAAYQEDGLPAGRWRVPTMAEIEFAIKLSSDGRIQSLFDPDADDGYWAGGKELRILNSFEDLTGINVSYSNSNFRYSKSGTNYIGYVRCVYDSWYWGNSAHEDYNASSPAWLGYHTSL